MIPFPSDSLATHFCFSQTYEHISESNCIFSTVSHVQLLPFFIFGSIPLRVSFFLPSLLPRTRLSGSEFRSFVHHLQGSASRPRMRSAILDFLEISPEDSSMFLRIPYLEGFLEKSPFALHVSLKSSLPAPSFLGLDELSLATFYFFQR